MTGYCVVDHCERLAYAKGYCKRHYMQVLRHGHLTMDSERGSPKECKVPDCETQSVSDGHCRKHARQIKVHGELRPDREYMTGKKVCSEETCDSKVRARGLCAKHYTKRRRSGTLP